MTLSSPAWQDGGQIPLKHTQPGGDVSPPLTWTNAPENVASYVLVVHDLDAPVSGGADDMLHWLVWNIPGAARELPAGIGQGATLPGGSRPISATRPNYPRPGGIGRAGRWPAGSRKLGANAPNPRGRAAPPAGPPHPYVFELYALDSMLEVPGVGASPPQTRAAVLAAIAGHVRGKGVFTGTFKRSE